MDTKQTISKGGTILKYLLEIKVLKEKLFSTIFGKTENWARVTYHRARLKIKERMDEHE